MQRTGEAEKRGAVAPQISAGSVGGVLSSLLSTAKLGGRDEPLRGCMENHRIWRRSSVLLATAEIRQGGIRNNKGVAQLSFCSLLLTEPGMGEG